MSLCQRLILGDIEDLSTAGFATYLLVLPNVVNLWSFQSLTLLLIDSVLLKILLSICVKHVSICLWAIISLRSVEFLKPDQDSCRCTAVRTPHEQFLGGLVSPQVTLRPRYLRFCYRMHCGNLTRNDKYFASVDST